MASEKSREKRYNTRSVQIASFFWETVKNTLLISPVNISSLFLLLDRVFPNNQRSKEKHWGWGQNIANIFEVFMLIMYGCSFRQGCTDFKMFTGQ
jgi:uncharacterized membrane protein